MIKKYLKNYLGEFLIILGAGLFFYNVFDFITEVRFGFFSQIQETLILITLGVVLAVAGIIFIKNPKAKPFVALVLIIISFFILGYIAIKMEETQQEDEQKKELEEYRRHRPQNVPQRRIIPPSE